MARSNRAAAPVTPPSADIIRPSQAGEYFLTRPAVTLQPTEKTLTDAEIEAVSQKIVAEVAKKTGAVLRG